MTQDELESLSKAELIHLMLEQAKLLAQLQAEVEALKLKLEQRSKPPTNSQNSSQPPSRDQKSNTPKDKRKHRHGPPQGHEKHERQFVTQPDKIVELRAKQCRHCHARLEDQAGRLVKINQITELPPAKAQVIEVRQYETICPDCGQVQVAQPPVSLEMERTFGARLEATVVYYRQEQHLSYERTQQALSHLHGVSISQGGIDGIMRRAGDQAIRSAEPIGKTVRQSAVIHSDETGSRVAGSNWWEWVFCTSQAIWHEIRFNRSEDVIREFMQNRKAEVWVSDCYSAQLNAPAHKRQLCMAHQLRNLQAVVEAHPTLTWARAMQMLFRYAIHLQHLRDQLSPDQFAAQVARVERHCDRLLDRSLIPADAKRLQKRYRKHRDKLFVFLERRDVEPTNNVAERALRPSVIHRKVMGCFRSEWGAKAFAALASVIDTAELAGIHAFDAIQSLFGSPSLPIPLGGE
jgi:transposase